MSKFLLPIAVALIFCYCSKSKADLQLNSIMVDSLNRAYLLGEDNLSSFPSPHQLERFRFRYRNGKFIIRSGGLVSVAASSGFSKIYLREIYDTVIYNRNGSIELTTKVDLPGYQMAPNKRIFTILNGKIQFKVNYGFSSTPGSANDTAFFYYSPNGKLERTVHKANGLITAKTYVYNTSNNLVRVSGQIRLKQFDTILYSLEETFGDYDTAANPLKAFDLWEETFCRSLSANNFRTYSYTKTDASSGTIVSESRRKWTLNYDKGFVNFSD